MKHIKKSFFLLIIMSSIFALNTFAKVAPSYENNINSEGTLDTQPSINGNGNQDNKQSNDVGANPPANNEGDALSLSMELAGGGSGVSQNSKPSINIYISNTSKQLLSGSLQPGFVSCIWSGTNIEIYKSNTISSFIINPATKIKKTILLSDQLTKDVGNRIIECKIGKWAGEKRIDNNTTALSVDVVLASRFDLSINRAIDPIKGNLDAAPIKKGKEGLVDFLITKVIDILIPLIILGSILTAILGFYKLFFATDDKAIGTGTKLLVFGVVGIILMMSAKFFANTLYSDIFLSGNIGYGQLEGYSIAQKLYEKLLFPFLKIAIYLSLGVLFVMLVSRVIGFVFGDDDTKKKAGTIITWNTIGMLLIIGSKSLVEFVYGKQADVVKSVSNLGEIGSGILSTRNYPFLYEVINRVMGLASLIILVMVLFQAFQLLMKPDAPDAMTKIKNSLLYIFIGIIIIGAGYIITNFLIIN